MRATITASKRNACMFIAHQTETLYHLIQLGMRHRMDPYLSALHGERQGFGALRCLRAADALLKHPPIWIYPYQSGTLAPSLSSLIYHLSSTQPPHIVCFLLLTAVERHACSDIHAAAIAGLKTVPI